MVRDGLVLGIGLDTPEIHLSWMWASGLGWQTTYFRSAGSGGP